MCNLPPDYLNRMKMQLGAEYVGFLSSYSRPAVKGIRVNDLKITPEEFEKISPFGLERVPWEPNGFYADAEKTGKNPLYAAGLYYPQEPSAMCAAPLLEVKGGERVLDLCAAPGGKTTQIAQAMKGEGVLIANEINFTRAKALSQNIERLGIKNAAVVCAAPRALQGEFGEYFDKILVDAPCSGEGMFKKEPQAIEAWSLKTVAACAERQSEILDCAYNMLRGGGRLVYSTCTFAPQEDEEQVQAFLARHPDCRLEEFKKLYPHRERGEGHFAAVIIKGGEARGELKPFKGGSASAKTLAPYYDFEKTTLKVKFSNLRAIGGTLYSLPDDFPDFNAQILRAGVRLGELKDGRFIPDHALAMCLKSGEANEIEVDEAAAVSYLSGNVIDLFGNGNAKNCENGWHVVTYMGYPLGWCKAVNGIAKNHYPKALRFVH